MRWFGIERDDNDLIGCEMMFRFLIRPGEAGEVKFDIFHKIFSEIFRTLLRPLCILHVYRSGLT